MSRRNLFSFGDNDTAGTKAGKSHAGGALRAKEELGWGGGAHREWCSVGERGDGERLCVFAGCLMPVVKGGALESQVPQGSIYPTGTRFHIPEFFFISGSPGFDDDCLLVLIQ